MAGSRSTTVHGLGFDEATIEAVWRKGKEIAGRDAATFRKDACGAWMKRSAYGSTEDLSWEIDHIKPVSKGGSDDLSNLQPLNWQNNRHKCDDWPNWTCAIQN